MLLNYYIQVHNIDYEPSQVLFPNPVEDEEYITMLTIVEHYVITDAQSINLVNYMKHYELLTNPDFNAQYLPWNADTNDLNLARLVQDIHFGRSKLTGNDDVVSIADDQPDINISENKNVNCQLQSDIVQSENIVDNTNEENKENFDDNDDTVSMDNIHESTTDSSHEDSDGSEESSSESSSEDMVFRIV